MANSNSTSTRLDLTFHSRYCWAKAICQDKWCRIKPTNSKICKCRDSTWQCKGAQVVALQYFIPKLKVERRTARSSWGKWRNDKIGYHTIRWNEIMISVKLFKSPGQGQWLHSTLPRLKFRLRSGGISTRVMLCRFDRLKCKVRNHLTTCFSCLQRGIRKLSNSKTVSNVLMVLYME